MTPDSVESRVGRLEREIHTFMGELTTAVADIRHDVTEMKAETREELGEIKVQTTKTNGRVSEIEIQRRIESATRTGAQGEKKKVKGWAIGVLTGCGILFGGVVTAVVSKLIGVS